MNEGIIGIKNLSQVSRMLSYNVPSKAYTKSERFVCPSCNSDISIKELVEKKGSIGCKNCSK